MKKILIPILIIFLLAGIAFAEETAKPFQEARYENINCHAQLAISYSAKMLELDENATTLAGKTAALNTNLAALSDCAANACAEFNSKSLATWESIHALNQEAKTYLKDFKGPKNKEKRVALKEALDSAKNVFLDCKKSAHISFAQGRINSYNNIISKEETRISKLQDKNIDTTELNAIIAQVKTDIIVPLETAVASADYNAVKDALASHCIFDGCETGNFHLEAKIEIARLNAILAKIKDKAAEAGISSEWQSAMDSLTTAKTALAEIGTAKYTKETKAAVWDKIKECANKIRELAKKKKGGN